MSYVRSLTTLVLYEEARLLAKANLEKLDITGKKTGFRLSPQQTATTATLTASTSTTARATTKT